MAYKPELEPNEKLALQIAFKVSEKSAAFNFAVSDQALYWPAIKAFAVNDATYFKRLRNNEISEVCIRRLPPYGLWVVAVIMVLIGIATTYFMCAPLSVTNQAHIRFRAGRLPFLPAVSFCHLQQEADLVWR